MLYGSSKVWLTSGLVLAGWGIWIESIAAQIVPDETLAGERSHLQRNVQVRGERGDRIVGGATRGTNLFHSFREFNVRHGERVYFANPDGIANILSRVTGSQLSEIMGTLGVDGGANLFLLNPNGIVFGANAQLDVRGSFLATTADRFLFLDGSSFSATAPQAPPLLTVNVPVGLQLGNRAGAIANHAHLSVPTGQTLSLIGGSIEMPGRLTAPSGQITLAAFSPDTTLALSPTFSLLSAVTPATVRSATLLVSGQIDTGNAASGQIGGSIQLLGDQVGLLTHAGLNASGESGGGQIWVGGDYQGRGTLPRAIATYIDPTATLRADALTTGNGGQIIAWSDNSTRAYGTFSVRGGALSGNGGLVETSSPNFLDTTGIRVDASAAAGINGTWLLDPLNVTLGYTGGVSTGGNFSGGNPNIFTPTMAGAIVNIPDIEAQLNAGTNVVITTGNTGTEEGNITADGFGINTNSAIPVSLTLQAANNIDLRNFGITANNAPLSMVLQADSDGSGAGDIAIRSAGMQLRGGGFSASTPGNFLLNSAGISSDNPATATTNAQPMTISANSVVVREAGINSTTLGDQSSSPIIINADAILIEQGGLGTRTMGNGDAGNVTVTTNTLQVRNNAGIGSSAGFTEENGQVTAVFPDSQGNTGLIDITANSILVENQSGFGNDTRARGNARGINLTAERIEFFNAGLGSNTYSDGNAGQITIIGEELLFRGDSTPANDGMGTNTFGSGNAGGIRIQGSTVLFERFGIGSETNALINGGRGGQVFITATDSITLRSSSDISSSSNGSGNAGQVELTAPTILFEDDSGLGSVTRGNGNAGQVRVNAGLLTIRDTPNSAEADDRSGIGANTEGSGNAGAILLNLGSLVMENAGIGSEAKTGNSGSAGRITIDATGDIAVRNSSISSSTLSSQEAGQITINGRNITFTEGRLNSNTLGAGDAGSIQVTGQSIAFNNSLAFSETNALTNAGRGGQINFTATDSITLQNRTDFSSSSNGSGDAGQVELTAPSILFEDDSGLGSVTRGSGNAGQVSVNAGTLVIRDTINSTDPDDRSGIGTNTEGAGNAGEILLNLDRLIIQNGGIGSEAKPGSSGRGGQIAIDANTSVELENSGIGSSTSSGQSAGQISLQAAILQMNHSELNSNTFSSGNAGQILIDAAQATLRDSLIETRTAASGDAGSIRFTGQSLTLLQDSLIDSGTAGTGDAGSIAIRAAQAVSLSDSVIATAVNQNASGQGGGIDLVTDSLSLTADAEISASTDGLGNAGNVNVTANQLAAATRGRIRTSTTTASQAGNIILNIATETQLTGNGTGFFADTDRTSTGDGGSIRLNTERLLIQDQAAIAVNSQGTGRAGNLDMTAGTARLDNRASVTAETLTSSGGNIRLNILQFLNLTDSQISASTQDGQGGSLHINLDQPPAHLVELLNGSRLTVQATGRGDAGDLTVNARTLRLEENAAIAATTTSGTDGTILLQGDRLQVNDSEISSATTTGRAGSLIATFTDAIAVTGRGGLSVAATEGGTAGNLSLTTAQLTLQRGAQASVSSTAGGRAGNLEVTAREVNISDRARLTAETEAGNGGNIRLQITDALRLNNGEISASTIDGGGGDLELNVNQTPTNTLELLDNSRMATEATGSGNAGNLILNTQIARLQENSVISGSTRSGVGGNIVLNGLTTLQVNNSEISASTRTGTAGNLSIRATDRVQLRNNGRLTVEATRAGGSAGNMTLQTRELNLQNQAALSAETIASNTGGNINLQINESLQLGNRSRISASTRDGQGGRLGVNENSIAIESVTLTGGSAIATEATRSGNAERLVINARQLTLQEGAEISASTRSGEGGDITLEGLNRLRVDNSNIAASTHTGIAGSVSIRATESINLSGEGGVLVEATGGGRAGSLNLATDNLMITEGAIASVSSPLGAAGSLTVDADTIQLDDGRLTAEAGRGQGANITLRVAGRLNMNRGSQISARATGNADGGNISIDATNGFIIAIPQQNNDILASAEQGNGGRIDITTQGIFGLEERNPLTPLSDINASSEFGLDGTITINRIVDPSRGLVELPAEVTDASQQIAQACPSAGSETIEDLGSFYVTGRGGLPPSPTGVLEGEDVITEWVDHRQTSTARSAVRTETQIADTTVDATVIEAQGWAINETGKIQLVAHIPNAASPLPMQVNCSESDRNQE